MEYRRLGNSGLQVSVIGLGTNNFGPRIDYPAAERVVRQAVDEGINFIETSNTYGEGQAEAFIGKALRGHRTQALVATKVASNMGDGPNMHGASRKHIMDQVDISLKKLQTDYLDLTEGRRAWGRHQEDIDTRRIVPDNRAIQELRHHLPALPCGHTCQSFGRRRG